ncbi:uncharacterized protein MKZ38_002279 [Zalerion maritima]|uniref:Mid2 domain-containing protein n=1 Tax=Zalerion maritima TaxID=339359 RepID=A0AAD5RQF7_9PEZI|nr:uncharacterized protein MKZ38_002279 [Zalerion maritima]
MILSHSAIASKSTPQGYISALFECDVEGAPVLDLNCPVMSCLLLQLFLSGIGLVSAGSLNFDTPYLPRGAPGGNSHHTNLALRRAISNAVFDRRDEELTASTNFSKGFTDALLYKQEATTTQAGVDLTAGTEISCTNCYTKGSITATLTVDGDFNATQAVSSINEEFEASILNVTEAAFDTLQNATSLIWGEFTDSISDFDLSDFDIDHVPMPTLDYDFNLENIEGIPELLLEFEFDDLELYVELATALSVGATYEMNLYTSQTAVGIKVSDELLLGIVLCMDLIIDVEAEVVISSGFHLQVDDGFKLSVGLFQQEVGNMEFPGGKFEFLPVTISSDGAALKALLRLGVKAGFEYKTPTIDLGTGDEWGVSMGITCSVWANLAKFVTNVTSSLLNSDSEEDDCDLSVVQYYEMAVGAAAGASVRLGTQIWGPTPNTTIPVFYTTLAEACATLISASTPAITDASATAAVTARAELDARQASSSLPADLTTSTVSTTVVIKGQSCLSSGLINCPASLQTTTAVETVLTTFVVVSSGEDATFPATTSEVVASLVTFGDNVRDIVSSSGSPTSYVPPKETSDDDDDDEDGDGDSDSPLKGETGGVSNKVILGVSIGLGVPVLIALFAGCWWYWKRSKYTRMRKAAQISPSGEVTDVSQQMEQDAGKSGGTVYVSQVPI